MVVTWSTIGLALAVGLLLAPLAGLLPARWAARLDVVEALRYEYTDLPERTNRSPEGIDCLRTLFFGSGKINTAVGMGMPVICCFFVNSHMWRWRNAPWWFRWKFPSHFRPGGKM